MARISIELQKDIASALSCSTIFTSTSSRAECIRKCSVFVNKPQIFSMINYDGHARGFTTELMSTIGRYNIFNSAMVNILESAKSVELDNNLKQTLFNLVERIRFETD
jgi:hypothetical protein